MSKRFQNFSKYRNSVLAPAKRDDWYYFSNGHINTAGDYNPLHASETLIAYRSGSAGNAVGIHPLASTGRAASAPLVLHNAAVVSDIQWSHLSHGRDMDILCTGGDDGSVKLWTIPKNGLTESVSTPTTTFESHARRVESLAFHSNAGGILASAAGGEIKIWDVETQQSKFVLNGGDIVQSIAWKGDGSQLASANKDNVLRIFDPRTDLKEAKSTTAHGGVKPTRVTWLGDSNGIFTTGFSVKRDREYALWDIRNLLNPVVLTKLDTSPGIVLPLHDPDTNMLYLCGKGDTAIRWLEVDPANSTVTPGAQPFMSGTVFSGAALVPKQALNVMQGEVARILSVASDGGSIIPVSVTVPRKTYMEFHADIFPDTRSSEPSLSAADWFAGQTKPSKLVSLDPKKRSQSKPDVSQAAPAPVSLPDVAQLKLSEPAKVPSTSPAVSSPPTAVTSSPAPAAAAPAPASRNVSSPTQTAKPIQSPPTSAPNSPPSATRPKFVAPKSSSYRFVTGKAQSKFDDLRGLSINMPSECNGLESTEEYLAIPMAGPGGRVAVWPTSQTGRLPVRLPCFLCGTDLIDFKWNPFEKTVLATGSDDGKVRLWKVPSEGIKEDSTESAVQFTAHTNRMTFIQFHPSVSDVLMTASPEQGSPTLKVWNLKTQKAITTIPHPDLILSGAFSIDGSYLATACRDKLVRVFEARTGKELQRGPSHEGIKGCRVLFLGESGKLCTVGFGKASQREINIYDIKDLSKPLSTTVIDTSPSLLIPIYDEDTSLLYLVGRGETYIPIYEITDTGATFLTRFESPGIQQGVSFSPKRTVDVRAIEVAKGWRMTQTAVERLSFTVPRLKKELFQDDIFVPTRDVERAAVSVEEWVKGGSGVQKRVDLAPADMVPLSQASVAKVERKVHTPLQDSYDEGKKKEETIKQMFETAKGDVEAPLEQDKMEGVADDEWDD
ncbi:Coronin-7 [Rhizophlyctis rosea]|nr:Coronin-7 [Rhizophlyctis rosea]